VTKKLLPAQAFRKLAALYADMQERYAIHAQSLGLTCENCTDNCCTSYFQHHTRVEWAYLLQGLSELPPERRAAYEARARDYVRMAQQALAQGERPGIMCPLNDDGRCGVYAHRLMICRLHGVPNRLRYPDGRTLDFPGCFRSQELCAGSDSFPILDRTQLYTRLMELEVQFVGPARIRSLPRVDLTLAEMIVQGPPRS
jgi:Fe-S-cluster containining protein